MIDIRLTGEFREEDDGTLKPGSVYIETDDTEHNPRSFLHKKINHKWLEAVVEKFRTGPGGDTE